MNHALTLHDLFRASGIDPSGVRCVRHTNREIPALLTFQNNLDKFTEYTAWQKPGKFGSSKYLAVFCPARGTNALFLGVWAITGYLSNESFTESQLNLLKKYQLPLSWFNANVRYNLRLTDHMKALSERLVIDWGKSTVSWVQEKNKPVLQIKPPNSIDEFISYDRVMLSYRDLQRLIKDTNSNFSWVSALSSVNGVYLIRHANDGKLYVGSAYGKGGILGRWSAYAKSGHAGNSGLKGLDPDAFLFSILEISPATMSAEDVIERENRWKECLGTREFGLNEN